MPRVLRHVLLVLAVLGVGGCVPPAAAEVPRDDPAVVSPTTSTTAAPPPVCCDAGQVRYFAAVAAAEREAADVARFLDVVAGIRAAVPGELRSIRWCEGGRYVGLPFGETNYAAVNQQGSSASGGYQVLDSTWRSWRRLVAGAERYARAVHAPSWIQDAVATAAYHRSGSTPWRASRACWARRR